MVLASAAVVTLSQWTTPKLKARLPARVRINAPGFRVDDLASSWSKNKVINNIRSHLRNETGSTLLLALIAVAIVGLMAATTMSMAGLFSQDKSRARRLTEVDTFSQRLSTAASDPVVCAGAPKALPVPLEGLTFLSGGTYGKTQFQNTPGPQEVRIQVNSTVLDGSAHYLFALPGGSVDGMPNVSVQSLFIQNPAANGVGRFTAQLGHRITVDGQKYADRLVGTLSLEFDSSTPPALKGCQLKQSSQIICENMGCKYLQNVSGVKCRCALPAMQCANSTPPRDYIVGINASISPPQPICRPFKVSCLDSPQYGKGFVLAGVNDAGGPICQPLEGNVTCTAPNTSTAGAGGPAYPAGCSCNSAGDVWNGTICGPAGPHVLTASEIKNCLDTWTGARPVAGAPCSPANYIPLSLPPVHEIVDNCACDASTAFHDLEVTCDGTGHVLYKLYPQNFCQ